MYVNPNTLRKLCFYVTIVMVVIIGTHVYNLTKPHLGIGIVIRACKKYLKTYKAIRILTLRKI